MKRPKFFWWLAVISLMGTVGCNNKATYPVEGKVAFPDGKPLAGGIVLFRAVDPENKASCRGIIQPDGRYQMGTETDTDGVPPGQYRVAISPEGIRNPERPPPGWPPFDDRFSRFDASNLMCTVIAGNNKFDFQVAKTVANP